MGFPGCKVQLALCFLKERSSIFLQSSLFFWYSNVEARKHFLSYKSLYIPWRYVFSYVGMKWITICLFYSCCVMVIFLMIFFLVRFLFIFIVLSGGVSCVFVHLLLSSLVLFTFGAGFVGTFLAGRVVSFFYVRLRYVECRAGTIYLSVGLEWVAGLYGFFFSWALLRWVRYD